MIQRVMLVRHINRPEAQAAAQAAARELSVRDIDVVPEGDCTGDIDLVLATGNSTHRCSASTWGTWASLRKCLRTASCQLLT